MAFEEQGFCVVRGPDLLWGGDIKRFHLPRNKFAGIIGGPPCQRWSRLANLVRHVHGEDKLAEDLIPEFTRCIKEARPTWYLMENVPGAPTPDILGYSKHSFIWNNRWCGGVQNRCRRFTWGVGCGHKIAERLTVNDVGLEPAEKTPALCASGTKWVPVAIGGSGKKKPGTGRPAGGKISFEDARKAQGLPDDFDLFPFKAREKIRALGNGVPLPLGRAIAKAVREAIENI
jgi:DNA (cytosine-5)-methyltransferase 1